MSKSTRLVISLVSILLLVFALNQGNTQTVDAAKPPTKKPPPPGPSPTPPPVPAGLRAGLRASNYGMSPFPSSTWWINSINSMASRFTGSVGEQVAVVVEVSGGGGRGNC